MDLPLASALVAAFALTLYVMLDGFDLGVGALLPLVHDEPDRDRMVASIAPTWDGNETWLIMAGVALLAAFPVAYGVLLPAFYLPLIAMLLSLGLRGVSVEFRFQTIAGRRFWDGAFAFGSIVAALAQGLIVGGLLQGVAVDGDRFAGSVFDVFRPLPIVVALAVLSGYATLGAGWLHLKTDGPLRSFAERVLRPLAFGFWLFSAAAVTLTTLLVPAARHAWTQHPAGLAFIAAGATAALGLLVRSVGGRRDGAPLALGVAAYALELAALWVLLFPFVIPYRRDLWSAASPTLSHVFLLAGVALVGPVVLAYTAFAYRVFRGKTPVEGWGA